MAVYRYGLDTYLVDLEGFQCVLSKRCHLYDLSLGCSDIVAEELDSERHPVVLLLVANE